MATPTITTAIADFIQGFTSRPIYAGGQKIGYWKPENNLCGGNAYLDQKYKPYPSPETWYTYNDLWQLVPVTEYCVKKGIIPSWATVSGTTVTAPSPVGGNPVSYTRNNDGTITASKPFGPDIPFTSLPVGLAVGGAGILGLLLLLRR
jgi:hypothetical protein